MGPKDMRDPFRIHMGSFWDRMDPWDQAMGPTGELLGAFGAQEDTFQKHRPWKF